MRKDEVEILNLIEKIQKDQIYLLQTPKTPQQQFLHLFAHRHLLKQKMLHRNIDRSLQWLEGTFAQSSLRLGYAALCIQNQVEVQETLSPLINLINNWINFYPSTQRRTKVLLGQLVLQDRQSVQEFPTHDLYLHYLNLISVDLWKLLTHSKEEEAFYKDRPLKEELSIWSKVDLRHLNASDLLTFVSSCIPKVLLNIILEKASLPAEIREKANRFECLYSNQNIEYFLRSSFRLSLLLKQIFLILLQMELTNVEQKLFMQVAIRYYYVYHFNRRFTAPEIVIYAFNKINEEVRISLKDEFALFVKILAKLGKQKFITFLHQNSPFLKIIVEAARNKPLIGYAQQSASPYNTIGIAQTITVERGATVQRSFEILQQYSIFYFRIVVASLDVTLKLYYLGEIGSPKESRMLLFTQEKRSGQIKSCINAMKKGIYQFQFDNTYSWINSKTLKYENVVYTPLQIKTVYTDQWIDDFYQNIYQNCMAKQDDIYLVKRKIQPKHEKPNTASLSRTEDGLSLIIHKNNQEYHYQTDNPERMEQKVVAITKSKEQYRWIAQNKTVDALLDLQNYIRGIPVAKPTLPVQKIQRYKEEQVQDEDQAEADEEEYEVVQRDLNQSQIFSDERPESDRPKLSARGQKPPTRSSKQPVRNQKEGKQAKKVAEQSRSKDQITCNLQETEQFYSQTSK